MAVVVVGVFDFEVVLLRVDDVVVVEVVLLLLLKELWLSWL